MMGYDTVYIMEGGDDEIVALSKGQERVILTRDRELTRRKGADSYYVAGTGIGEQLADVASFFRLRFREGEMRCSVCNGLLVVEGKGGAAGLVPEGVLERNEIFRKCSGCGKLYWKGTHWRRIMERIEGVLRG